MYNSEGFDNTYVYMTDTLIIILLIDEYLFRIQFFFVYIFFPVVFFL